jgi:hypothetical protein
MLQTAVYHLAGINPNQACPIRAARQRDVAPGFCGQGNILRPIRVQEDVTADEQVEVPIGLQHPFFFTGLLGEQSDNALWPVGSANHPEAEGEHIVAHGRLQLHPARPPAEFGRVITARRDRWQ